MKIAIIFLMMIGLLVVVGASSERAELAPGESFTIANKNVTLITVDDTHDNTIFCVNGVKGIVSEDDSNIINEVTIEVLRIRRDVVDVDADYTCKNCDCGDECDNSVCYDIIDVAEDIGNGVDEIEVISGENGVGPISDEEGFVEPVGIGTKGILFAVLIIIILILGLIVLWKKT